MMRLWERLFVATLNAINVWFDTVTNGTTHVDPPRQRSYDLKKGSLWEDEPSTIDEP